MEYKVNELAKLSGVSTRTLRYYDSIGLLKPDRTDPNGYRIYCRNQVDLLQQILFYRELGLELNAIRSILYSPDYDRQQSLESHLNALLRRREQIDTLIQNVKNTINSTKGNTEMTDKDKFEGFKKNIIEKNTKKYGDEVKKRYGTEAFEASNAKVGAMSEKEWNNQASIEQEMFALLKTAMEIGDSTCEEAHKAADLHRQWLSSFWGDGLYTKESHLALADGYLADKRFTEYYDKALGEGGTRFLRDAIAEYIK